MAWSQLFPFIKKIRLLFYFLTLEISFNKIILLQDSFFSVECVTSLLSKLAYVHKNMSIKYYATNQVFGTKA